MLVLWVATCPEGNYKGELLLIGWYQNATVYRREGKPPEGSNRLYKGDTLSFNVETEERNAHCLELNERSRFRIPHGRGVKGGFGQKALWYANATEHFALKQMILALILDKKFEKSLDYEDRILNSGIEGQKKEVTHQVIQRDLAFIARYKEECRKKGNLRCKICGFSFDEKYPDISNGFIEAHHIEPISKYTGNHVLTEKDIILVCANCHRMLHRGGNLEDNLKYLAEVHKK